MTAGLLAFTGGPATAQNFSAPMPHERNYTITGITRDASGQPLGSCTVHLFAVVVDGSGVRTYTQVQTTISDGGGNYTFVVDKTQTYGEIGYLAGSPDVFGTTSRTLVGA